MTARKPVEIPPVSREMGKVKFTVVDDTPKREYHTRGIRLPGGEYAWAMLPDDMSRTEYDVFIAGLQKNRADWSWPDE